MHPLRIFKCYRYFTGNYVPIDVTIDEKPCEFEGAIPEEFLGGQYVRNGSNLMEGQGHRQLHWFDGDGLLTGVFFSRFDPLSEKVRPLFTNRYVETDVYRATRINKRIHPILPGMAALVDPVPSPFRILLSIMRTYVIIFASLFKLIARPIQRVGTANTNILYHDGRVLATNEIGPPMRVHLPSLKTIGWFTGSKAEGEPACIDDSDAYFGGKGIEGFYKEMTTAHPRVDQVTGELVLFHSTFLAPFVQYSVVPAKASSKNEPRLNMPIPGLSSGKLMHDFGVSRNYTVIIDCPISLDPFNLRQNLSPVQYDPNGPTRLGVFPRNSPHKIKWYETAASIVMHTANTWDESTPSGTRVHILLCRMNSFAPLYHMGGMEAPKSVCPDNPQSRLYYYQITSAITQQWALSSIPFEFPHVPRHLEMTTARYIYGCSMREGNFASQLMECVKIDCLAKIDAKRLLEIGQRTPPVGPEGSVDTRTMQEILCSEDPDDPIQVFAFPHGWYAQECSFVPRKDGKSEDDGWLVTYAFDESQLNEEGEAKADSRSELWIIDAVGMEEVVAKVFLPQRVPYGMHGNWFAENQILNQRDFTGFRF
ncbi:9-cis-epoxycarotenoid dioxygenase [Penicillium malachiteum]|nr:9-cis-epoxycarotenoid dioxygenase [Penicillium malachiteum]